jgi:hypothetical protein
VEPQAFIPILIQNGASLLVFLKSTQAATHRIRWESASKTGDTKKQTEEISPVCIHDLKIFFGNDAFQEAPRHGHAICDSMESSIV